MAEFISEYINLIPRVSISDAVEIIIISFAVYQMMRWIQSTRAWGLFKGIVVLMVFMLLASIFRLNTILWIADKTLGLGINALIIIFHPELRKALEQLGRKNIFTDLFSIEDGRSHGERFSDKTVNELVKASFELGKEKTGALIVIEKNDSLKEYERTGIALDAILTSQLLVNIFEHNTPLHDGAVLVRENRVVSATCYLPLSDSLSISKELGTRHRAAIGISEATDSVTIIVSEETGAVSLAYDGKIHREVNSEFLKEELVTLQNKTREPRRFKLLKGRRKNEKKDTE